MHEQHRVSSHNYTKTLGVVSLSALLTACSPNIAVSSLELQESVLQPVEDITIAAGSNLRTSPEVRSGKDDGITNLCYETSEPIELPTINVLVNEGDANGPYFGIEATLFPGEIEDACKSELGIIWVATSNIPSVAADK